MTHQITGVGLAVVSGAALDVPVSAAVVLVGASWLGSMLPDADLAGARVYRRTRVERRVLLARGVGSLARLPLRLLVVLPHRGVTHSLFAGALAAVLAGILVSLAEPSVAVTAGAGMAIGYLAHIAADACTPSGVAVWAPVSRRRHHLLPAPARIPTGSLREYGLAALLATLLLTATVVLTG
jgi:inner membrane protein